MTFLIDGFCGRKLYMIRRKEMLRQSIQSVLGQSKSSKDVLTEKQRAEVVKNDLLLSRGESPYAGFTQQDKREEGKTYGQGDRSKDTKQVIFKETPKEEIKAKEAYWKSGQGKDSLKVELPEDLVTLSPTQEALDPSRTYCSFCSKDITDYLESATRGQGRLRKKFDETIKDVNGVKVVETKVTHYTTKELACEDCCLKIKKVKFPETEG